MGSEHSSQAGQKASPSEEKLPEVLQSPTTALLREGGLSPRQDSVCSDSDVPFVSYTVNKPIGDSPKKSASGKAGSSSGSGRSRFSSPRLGGRDSASASNKLSKSAHNTLITVNKLKISDDVRFDPELIRLQEIPSFFPIMQSAVETGKGPTHSEILSRLDPSHLNNILQRYEDFLRQCATQVASEQGSLNKRVREVELEAVSIANSLQERQRQYEKHCEKLASVRDISRTLAKCHMLLNENIDMMDALNSALPTEVRLEPFVWTTG